GIRIQPRRGSHLPLFVALLDSRDCPVRIRQSQFSDVLFVDLKSFFLGFFLLLLLFLSVILREVNVSAKSDKNQKENRCALEFHPDQPVAYFLRFVQTEIPVISTPAGNNSNIT